MGHAWRSFGSAVVGPPSREVQRGQTNPVGGQTEHEETDEHPASDKKQPLVGSQCAGPVAGYVVAIH
jgi:hypothetical protein